jgi:hypothetical protein
MRGEGEIGESARLGTLFVHGSPGKDRLTFKVDGDLAELS